MKGSFDITNLLIHLSFCRNVFGQGAVLDYVPPLLNKSSIAISFKKQCINHTPATVAG